MCSSQRGELTTRSCELKGENNALWGTQYSILEEIVQGK